MTKRELKELSETELKALLDKESQRLRSIDPKERRIARRKIEEIEEELTRRYEKSFGL
jgi:hypothetical protein